MRWNLKRRRQSVRRYVLMAEWLFALLYQKGPYVVVGNVERNSGDNSKGLNLKKLSK